MKKMNQQQGAGTSAPARRGLRLGALAGLAACWFAAAAPAAEPIAIGLDADFTGFLKASSVALRQGIEVAIDEINGAGGVAGRPLRLVVTDHRGNPRRGEDNLAQMLEEERIVALLTGAHSSVALAQVAQAAEAGVPLLSPWAAATAIVDNGLTPNPAFRVSVRDADAAGFLVGRALDAGLTRMGLLVENTPWGQSNDAGVRAALEGAGLGELAGTGWFGHGGEDFDFAAARLLALRPDAVLFVGQPDEGAALIEAVATLPVEDRPTVLMHWGVSAGDAFGRRAGAVADVEFAVLQTFSFFEPRNPPLAERMLATACRLHAICAPEDAPTPVGLAQGYDATHLLALGLAAEASGAWPDLRTALENLPSHEGLVRHYRRAFSPDRHEALNRSDFILVRFDESGLPRPIEIGDPK